MHEKFQMSSIGELTFFLGLQVQQKKDGIFISQDKYVVEILKKFGLTKVKTTSTPMETQKPLLKDKDGEEVDVYMYRSMIGSMMYLTSSRPDIMFAVCACARYQVNPKVSHLHAVKRIFRYLKGEPKLGLWYLKDSFFDLVAYTGSDYARASLDRKSTTGGKAKKSVRLIMEKLIGMEFELMLSSDVAKTINGEEQLHVLVDGKRIVTTETSVRRTLRLADAEGIDYFSNSTIFENLALMVYEKISEKLTFYKAFLFPQWKFLIHTILQCLSPKTTAWNEFSSTMASVIICLAINQKFNFSKLIFNSMVRNLDNLSVDEAIHKERGDSLVRAATTASSLEAEQDNGNIDKTRSKATPNEPSSPGTSSGGGPSNTLQSGEDSLKLKELMELCTNLQQIVLDLEKTKTTQAEEIVSLKRMVKKLKLLKEGRIDADDDITLVSVHDVNVSAGEEEVVEFINTAKLIIDVAQVSATGDKVSTAGAAITVSVSTTTTATTVDEITLAQDLADLKSTKPKAKGIAFREPGESTTTTPIPSKIQDKGKAKMIEPEPVKKLSKKDQLKLDEKIALKLQLEIDEEERITRAKEEKINEANIAWDDIQAKIDVDYQLAERLQAKEQEQFTIEQKATLFKELMKQKRKHFAAKRAEEKRNKPPTKNQQKKTMITFF
ncbi:uncharacterized mitochondrial protein-like protein [Tanacetum coccineum]